VDISTGYPFYISEGQKTIDESINEICDHKLTTDDTRDDIKVIRGDSKVRKTVYAVVLISTVIISALAACLFGPIGFAVAAFILIAGTAILPVPIHHYFKKENRERDFEIVNVLVGATQITKDIDEDENVPEYKCQTQSFRPDSLALKDIKTDRMSVNKRLNQLKNYYK
jgi:hypothetical protein